MEADGEACNALQVATLEEQAAALDAEVRALRKQVAAFRSQQEATLARLEPAVSELRQSKVSIPRVAMLRGFSIGGSCCLCWRTAGSSVML